MESPQQLLNAAYERLGYAEGDLLNAADSPSDFTSHRAAENWINKGEWLALAKNVEAEKVFFVDNNPVIVFATADSNKQQERFRKIWNMARPPLLFLASPGELAVYNLNQGPARDQADWEKTLEKRRFKTAATIAEVSRKLQEFGREQIETGRLFEDERFGEDKRADKALIADLQVVRNGLLGAGLEAKYAHSLIGRSIFIRYLEDRDILEESYFKKITRGKPEWRKILDEPLSGSFVDPKLAKRFYLRVLRDKGFTYALFKQLSKDFNGDIFPDIEEEQANVEPLHLQKLQGFLCGNADGDQLFFFAYKFDVIPIELISSIYEEFYNTGKSNSGNNGSHYTPPALVEFLLSQVLSPECLDKKPRILDPACGSGIFLVESFRRIVRHTVWSQKGRCVSDIQLREILREQISGIDINGEAVRVAALSLYLAFLHYQMPPDILQQLEQGKRLPNLKYEKGRLKKPEQHYDILLEANSFDVESKIAHDDVLSRFNESCADVVVGNPPWGAAPLKKNESGREALRVALQWCEDNHLSVGDEEPSQAFIHRVVNLLHKGGCTGLLVSSGVLFKQSDQSRLFRRQWLDKVLLEQVVNFSHVRDVFFNDAIAPFVSVVFRKEQDGGSERLVGYWGVKKTTYMDNVRVVSLNKADLHFLKQEDLVFDELLWKTFWWGGHRDKALIDVIKLNTALDSISDDCGPLITMSGSGFKGGAGKCTFLGKYMEYPARSFYSYGPITKRLKKPPAHVARERKEELYCGLRLLVKHGPVRSAGRMGQIMARLEKEAFSYRHSIYGFRLRESLGREPKILLAILWSSLAKYYFFLTAGQWGTWYDILSLEEVRKLPIRFPDKQNLRRRIIKIVDELQEKGVNTTSVDIFDGTTLTFEQTVQLEHDLDEAIFDLYELNEAERDLIRDMCEYGLDLFYNNVDSRAVKPVEAGWPANDCGVIENIPSRRDLQKGFEGYIRTFLRIWNRELEPTGEFRWELIRPGSKIPMVAMVFSTQEKKKPLGPVKKSETAQWHKVLEKLDKTQPAPVSRRVYIDGVVRAVSDTDIMIIKRNERRLWTRSVAREDAEATLLQAIHLQERSRGQH